MKTRITSSDHWGELHYYTTGTEKPLQSSKWQSVIQGSSARSGAKDVMRGTFESLKTQESVII